MLQLTSINEHPLYKAIEAIIPEARLILIPGFQTEDVPRGGRRGIENFNTQ